MDLLMVYNKDTLSIDAWVAPCFTVSGYMTDVVLSLSKGGMTLGASSNAKQSSINMTKQSDVCLLQAAATPGKSISPSMCKMPIVCEGHALHEYKTGLQSLDTQCSIMQMV